MAALAYQLHRFGTGALMVTLTDPEQEVRRRLAPQVRNHLLAAGVRGVDDVVSGLESLLVEFDPLETTVPETEERLRGLLDAWREDGGAPSGARTIRITVLVSPETAPDLPEVAAQLGIEEREVLRRLEGSELTISLLAAAMAPMMNGLDVPEPVARQATPRTDVPPGSIMVAGTNAIVQPFPGPSGWKVVGRTPLRIVDVHRDPPVAFAPGDSVRFHVVDAAEAAELEGGFLGDAAHDPAGPAREDAV